MEKLIKIFDSFRYKGVIRNSIICAEESKKIAIEFAKYLSQQTLTKSCSMDDKEIYWPKTYQLMYGDLLKNSDNIFDNFLESYEHTS